MLTRETGMMRRTKDTPYPLSRLIVTTEMKVANTWRRPEYVNFIYMITKVVGCDEIRLPPYALFRICEFRLYARRATAFAFLRADCLLRPGRRRPEYVHFAYMRDKVGFDEIRLPLYTSTQICAFRLYARRATAAVLDSSARGWKPSVDGWTMGTGLEGVRGIAAPLRFGSGKGL